MAEVPSISVKNAAGQTVDVATITALNTLIGEVQVSPTANTLLERLKALKTSVDAGNGGVTETAPSTDTASSGLNGRMQRIAQRLTSLIALVPQALGPQAKAGSLSITVAADQGAIDVNQVSSAYDVALAFARPADTTAYLAGDVLGGALTFGAIGPSGKTVVVAGAQLEIDVAAIPAGMTGFRLYLYGATPPSALADNAAFDLPSGDRATFLGFIDLGMPADLGSTLYVEVSNINKQVKLTTAALYGYLVTAGAFTPGSGDAFKITIHTQAV